MAKLTELPREIWHIIATALSGAAERHLYGVLVRVAKRFYRPEMKKAALVNTAYCWLEGRMYTSRGWDNYRRNVDKCKLHRDDGPAWESARTTMWFQHGRLHRDNGPALTKQLFRRTYIHGLSWNHRESSTAYLNEPVQLQVWYNGGRIHREDDLPAVVYSDGLCAWFRNDKCYRRGHESAVEWTYDYKYL